MAEELRHRQLGMTDLDGEAGQRAARCEDMVEGTVAVIGGGGRAEQTLQPEAERPHIQRRADIALVLDRLIERVLGVAALTQQRVVAERALGPQAGFLERQPFIAVGRKHAVARLEGSQQRAIGAVSARLAHDWSP